MLDACSGNETNMDAGLDCCEDWPAHSPRMMSRIIWMSKLSGFEWPLLDFTVYYSSLLTSMCIDFSLIVVSMPCICIVRSWIGHLVHIEFYETSAEALGHIMRGDTSATKYYARNYARDYARIRFQHLYYERLHFCEQDPCFALCAAARLRPNIMHGTMRGIMRRAMFDIRMCYGVAKPLIYAAEDCLRRLPSKGVS